ncbi:MAG: hypothetical protein OIN85_08785 [Candidatus Methanoperedens sp.]|nr:hypothetical protein [Candidatus Methanoperedens sp.]
MELNKIFYIGWKLQYIKRTPMLNASVKGDNHILDNLKALLDDLKASNLSRPTQKDLEVIIKNFELYEEKQALKPKDGEMIVEKVKLWVDRITNELSERKMIEVYTDGTLNFKKLLEGGSSFFEKDVWDMLSPIQQSDINDACNCLLTKSWTPSVMISLRAAEDSIRNFYKYKTGNDSQNKGWKSLLDELSKIKDINKSLLGYLDYVRDIRNTAEHPDEIFAQMEAERVFHQVVNMITVICQELPK